MRIQTRVGEAEGGDLSYSAAGFVCQGPWRVQAMNQPTHAEIAYTQAATHINFPLRHLHQALERHPITEFEISTAVCM